MASCRWYVSGPNSRVDQLVGIHVGGGRGGRPGRHGEVRLAVANHADPAIGAVAVQQLERNLERLELLAQDRGEGDRLEALGQREDASHGPQPAETPQVRQVPFDQNRAPVAVRLQTNRPDPCQQAETCLDGP